MMNKKDVHIQFMGDQTYKIFVKPEKKELIFNDIKAKLEQKQLEKMYLSFSLVEPSQISQIKYFLQELLPIIQEIKQIGLILQNIVPDYQLVEFCSKLKDLISLDISCWDEESTSLLLLKSIDSFKLQTLILREYVSRNSQYHEEFINILSTLKSLTNLNLQLKCQDIQLNSKYQNYRHPLVSYLQIEGCKQIYEIYLPLFPNLKQLFLEPSYQHIQFAPDIVNHLTQVEELSIQSIDNVRLKNLVNLQSLSITSSFSSKVVFEDFHYLKRLQVLKINLQLDLEQTKLLNFLQILTQECQVYIQTIYLSLIQELGSLKNISLHIQNNCLCSAKHNEVIINSYFYWLGVSKLQNLVDFKLFMCHGETFTDQQILTMITQLSKCQRLTQLKYNFFCKRERQACKLTQQQESDLASNTDLLYFETDLNTSQPLKDFLKKKQYILYQLFIYDKFIRQQLNINSSACFYDLYQSII